MSNSCQITIQPEGKTINCRKGDDLLSLLQQTEYDLQADCGGKGSCGRCQIQIIEGENFTYRGDKKPSPGRQREGYYLACQLIIEDDLVIRIPESSLLTEQKILIGSEEEEKEYVESIYGGDSPVEIAPLYCRTTVKLPPPSLRDNTADRERLVKQLNREETGGKSGYVINNLELIARLPSVLRENNWELTVGWADFFTHRQIIEILSPTGKSGYGIAVDIGTTTVVASLFTLAEGRELNRKGEYNRQSRYGEDVISRINYAGRNEDGVETLQRALIKTINRLIAELIAEEDVQNREIKLMVAAGNTTMTHSLYGIDPNYIRRSPYIPTFTDMPPLTAGKLGLDIFTRAPVYSFPAIGSFVGGDIISGVLASGLHRAEKLTMLVDIGTNGEIVIGNRELLIACSASAGPAFEGGGISCGVRAMEGAIEQVNINDDYHVSVRTIGNKSPAGICGTGLIDLLSTLQKNDIINRSGRFNSEIDSGRLRKRGDGVSEFLLVPDKNSGTGDDIVITENDIKHLLRSKAAIYAGIKIMLGKLNLEEEMIQKVYIAGGFGNYLNIEASIAIGLFPDLPRNRFQFIGNSSLQGARRGLLSGAEFREARELARKMTYLELSSEDNSGDFMDEFVAAQFIPHTDLSLFSSV